MVIKADILQSLNLPMTKKIFSFDQLIATKTLKLWVRTCTKLLTFTSAFKYNVHNSFLLKIHVYTSRSHTRKWNSQRNWAKYAIVRYNTPWPCHVLSVYILLLFIDNWHSLGQHFEYTSCRFTYVYTKMATYDKSWPIHLPMTMTSTFIFSLSFIGYNFIFSTCIIFIFWDVWI